MAVDQFRKALTLFDLHIYRVEAAHLMHNLGVALYRQGERAEATRQFEQALAVAELLHDKLTVAYIDYRLAMISLDEDKPAEAERGLAHARPTLYSVGSPILQMKERLATAEVLSRQGRRSDSLKALEEARELQLQAQDKVRDVAYYEAAAKIHARAGDTAEAYEQMQLLRDAERANAEMANDALATELRARFDVQRQEHDNALQVAHAREDEARRLLFWLVLLSSVLLMGGLGLTLHLQVRQKRRFAELALRDELTSLPNRRSMLDQLEEQLRGRRENDAGLHVAVLDLDHFKQINDCHGHDIGDAVLRAFTLACQPLLRDSDRLGRIGGEEFLLLLPHADETSVRAVFERMQHALAAVRVPGVSFEKRLSFSMGAARAGTHDGVHALLKRADEALYAAKAAGRNCCIVVGVPTGPNSASALPRSLAAKAVNQPALNT
jgi:diguanylate cyclase (GGDEF)-like protein